MPWEYYPRYQVSVLHLFCSLPFLPRLTRPHFLPGLARVLRNHLFGGVAGIGSDLVIVAVDKARFKLKARRFVAEHKDHISLLILRRGEALTTTDLAELERMMIATGVADVTAFAEVKAQLGLGTFLRSLTGFDRAAAKAHFGSFVALNRLSASQNTFLEMVIDSLCENGMVDPGSFYESSFTDLDEMGIAGLFGPEQSAEIIRIVQEVNRSAAA